MANLLNVGTRAMTAFQTAISTTGNNIVNANTEGYSRQRVNLGTESGSFQGSYYIGHGVKVDSIQRVYDEILRTELINRSSSNASMDTLYGLSSQLEELFAEPHYGAQAVLDTYQSALNDVANNPGSMPERQVLVAETQNLVHRLQTLSASLGSMDNSVRVRLGSDIEAINDLASRLAEINRIVDSDLVNGIEPNELLDERDRLLTELAEKIDIHTITQENGITGIYMRNGTALVNGLESIELTLSPDEFGTGIEINQQGVSGGLPMSALLSGGSLGGLLQFQADVLNPVMQDFGLMSLALAESMNAQQQQGLDLRGNPGSDLFQTPSMQAMQSDRNAGSASISLDVADFTQLDASDYELTFDGAQWTMSNLHSGASTTGAIPMNFEGLDLTLTGTAIAGDRFLIQPAKNTLGKINLALTDPNGIAAAAAVRTRSSLSNQGASTLSEIEVSNLGALPLAADIQLTFDPDALGVGVPGFTVTGIASGPLAYDPATDSAGISYSLGGVDFRISGVPQTGDSHDIVNNTGAMGDGSNAQVLADILDAKLLTNSNRSLPDLNSALLGFMGSKTASAESSLAIESTLLNSAEQAVVSNSGVNLDEEAADLLRYQQAYQAAAQIISIAEDLFNTLLEATR